MVLLYFWKKSQWISFEFFPMMMIVSWLWIFFFNFFPSYGWYFTFIQGFVYLLLIYLQGFTTKQMMNPWKTYVKLSAVLMGSHGLTKGSLAFLNYPAQLMFKSTKVHTKFHSLKQVTSSFLLFSSKWDLFFFKGKKKLHYSIINCLHP